MTRDEIIAQGLKDPEKLTGNDRAVWNEIWASVQTEKGLNDVVAAISDVNIAMQLVSRLDLERRERQQKEADEANRKFTEAQAEIIKNARVKEIKADKTRTEYDKDIHIEGLKYETERFAGKGRFKAAFEKYGDALKAAGENDEDIKDLYQKMSEYIALNEQWGSRVSLNAFYDFDNETNRDSRAGIYRLFKEDYRNELREQYKKEQELISAIRAKSKKFLKQQTELQEEEAGDSIENTTLFAASEEINLLVNDQVDGLLDTKNPYVVPYGADDKNPVTLFEAESKTFKGKDLLSATKTEVTDKTKPQDIRLVKGKHRANVKVEKSYVEADKKDARRDVLFPHEPSPMDVVQDGLGDCYLLAGLAALAEKSPQKIKESICDNNDGTVTVRFLHKELDENTGELVGYKPLLVTVDKIVPDGGVSSSSLWVQMFERAYAASGLALARSASASMLPADPEYLNNVRNLYNGCTDKLDWLTLQTKNSNAFIVNSNNQYEVVGDKKAYSDIDAGYSEVFLEQLLGPEGSSDCLDPQNIPEAKVEAFINDSLRKNGIITAGTAGTIKADNKSSLLIDGLVPGHAYTVLGIREKMLKDSDGNDNLEKVVVIRNPWGLAGRDYDEQGKNIETFNNAGVSEIRLSDFCKDFSRLSVNKGALGDIKDIDDKVQAGHKFVTKNIQLSYIEQIKNFRSVLKRDNKRLNNPVNDVRNKAYALAERITTLHGLHQESFYTMLESKVDDLQNSIRKGLNSRFLSQQERDAMNGLWNITEAIEKNYMDPTQYFKESNLSYTPNKEKFDYQRPALPKKEEIEIGAVSEEKKPDKISDNIQKEPANGNLGKAKEDYLKAFESIRTILAKTDEGYWELKNSGDYKKLRTALKDYAEAIRKSDPDKLLSKLADSKEGKNLQRCCEKYLKHCYSSIRNNERRNTRMDGALVALNLVNNMSKKVEKPESVFPLCYSEKVIREKMYNLLESGNKQEKLAGDKLAGVMQERHFSAFTRELMKSMNIPKLGFAIQDKSFDELNQDYLSDKYGIVEEAAKKMELGETAAMQQKDKIVKMQQNAQNMIR